MRTVRFPAIGWLGLGLVATFVALAVAAPWISPYPPADLVARGFEAPSGNHILGTNAIGQDLASQFLSGARVSLLVAVLAGSGTVLLGSAVGLAAGWRGGMVDAVLMRLVDVTLTLPRVPLLIVVGAFAGRSLLAVAAVIALVFWPGTARLVRGQVRSLRTRAHVKAAVGFGAGSADVLRRHVVPEISLILVAALVAAAGRAVALEAGLAFLGLGDPARTSWGSIMNAARRSPGLFYTQIWTWWMLPPVLAIVLVLLGVTFLGVAVEQRANPRLSRHVGGRA